MSQQATSSSAVTVWVISPARPKVFAEHAGHEGLDVEWVLAEDVAGGGFAEVTENAVGAVQGAAFADPDQAVIGLYFDYGQVSPLGAQHHRRYFGYFHWSPLRVGFQFRDVSRIL